MRKNIQEYTEENAFKDESYLAMIHSCQESPEPNENHGAAAKELNAKDVRDLSFERDERPPRRPRDPETVSPCKYAGLNYFDGIYTIREDRAQELTDRKQMREEFDTLQERYEAKAREHSAKKLKGKCYHSRSPIRQ